MQAVKTYKNVPATEYVNASHVDPIKSPLNERFRHCGSLPSFHHADLRAAQTLLHQGMPSRAQALLLKSQPPAWPRRGNNNKRKEVCQTWYNIVHDDPSNDVVTRNDWMALLAHHRRDTYDTVLNNLACAICGDATSYDGNVIVFCDALWYCRGGVAYHQLCIDQALTNTADVWHCKPCRLLQTAETDPSMFSPMDALIRKRQFFADCWRQRSPIKIDDPLLPRVFQPSEYVGPTFTAARFLMEAAPPTAVGEQPLHTLAYRAMQTVDDECEEARWAGRRLDEQRRLPSHGSHSALAAFRVALMQRYPHLELPFPRYQTDLDLPAANRSTFASVEVGNKFDDIRPVDLTGLILDDNSLTAAGGGVRMIPHPFVHQLPMPGAASDDQSSSTAASTATMPPSNRCQFSLCLADDASSTSTPALDTRHGQKPTLPTLPRTSSVLSAAEGTNRPAT